MGEIAESEALAETRKVLDLLKQKELKLLEAAPFAAA
jgi:hypothetical protein